ncbi:uncharacterized protein [Battus philenor]|uniref:uncharacterized protein n=1 Tax=Battus philenor TaxID=42288 RepID=UPI0035D098AC
MNLTDLPEEILVIIIRKLNLKSVYNLYGTCNRLKYIISSHNVIKTASLALSTMATVQTLKLNFMKDISRHLLNLDLRGINDLNKTSLLIAVKRMKCLKSLDVSYTNITITDLIQVYKQCTTLKNIACNFVFSTKESISISPDDLIKSQDLFKNFDNIHFVGNAGNLLYSNLPLWILRKTNLRQLQLTVVEHDNTVYEQIEEVNLKVDFKFIKIYVLTEWKLITPSSGSCLPLPSVFTADNKYEFIAIDNFDNRAHIKVSPIFENYLDINFNQKSECVNDTKFLRYIFNGVVMLWNKYETVFDENFFKILKSNLVDLFPCCIKDDGVAVPEYFDKFIYELSPYKINTINPQSFTVDFKKKRICPPPIILNYDTVFSKKEKVHLTLVFHEFVNYSVVLLPSSLYLRKLTYLSLSGKVHYSGKFFNVLFTYCEHLETLTIEASVYAPCSSVLARNIPLSQSIKNLWLTDRRIDFTLLFSSLSQCSLLENIHVMDICKQSNDFHDLSTLFERCNGLYYLYILVTMSQSAKAKKIQLLRKLKERCNKNYLRVQLCTNDDNVCNYDPYVNVFALNPIKPPPLLYWVS